MSNKKVYIIAEAGVNHNGSINMAKELIEVASKSGADAIKFQSFKTELLVTEKAEMASYQKKNSGQESSQFEMLKKLELGREDHLVLKEYCEQMRIEFLSTPFDIDSLNMLCDEFHISKIKVSSGDLTNSPFLFEIAKKNKPVILSTGMANLEEIEEALSVLAFGFLNSTGKITQENFRKAYESKEGQRILKDKVSILHCTTQYPTEFKEVNLNAMRTIKEKFGLLTGYSDHTLGLSASLGATALGAKIIEKHFSLDKKLPGPDHACSLEPQELNELVKSIREIEMALGSFEKQANLSELENMKVARKSLVAAKDIKKGDIFSEENLSCKRPGEGVAPINFWSILNTTSSKDYKKDELIKL